MKSVFRWGIIGTGGIALAFAHDLQKLQDHTVAAVGSRSSQKGHSFASQFADCKSYGSYEELVEDSDLDGIYVATPHTTHVSNTILALRAGKPVLCEKPFAVNANEAEQMINMAREMKLPLMEAMWTRFLPHIKKAHEIISSGVIGEIVSIEADHGQRLAPLQIPRLMLPEFAGGALLDLGIYPISFAHMLLGVPEKIIASASMTDEGVDAQTSAIFHYATGAQAILTSNMMTRTPCRAVVSGMLGRIEIDSIFYNPAPMRLVLNDGSITEYPNTYEGHGLREEAIEFARMVRAGQMESTHLTLDETLEIMRSLDEIREIVKLKFPFE